MKNYADRPSASVDNTLRDLFNSSYPKKAEFINFFIISFKIIPSLKTYKYYSQRAPNHVE